MQRPLAGLLFAPILAASVSAWGPTNAAGADAAPLVGQWTAEQAWAWHRAQPWRFACNFLPSTAVNDVEMWQAETFDPATIDRELGRAQAMGVNGVRIFLNYVVWEQDAEGLRDRFSTFLNLAAKHGIAVMPVLLDDCNFAEREAKAGPQPDPVPGVHNSQWVSSPPLKMVSDQAAWPKVEAYVKDLVGKFGRDGRVAVWDLYNEPGNSGMGAKSLPLVGAAFRWAREAAPRQPLTVGAWTDFGSPMQRRMMELSDVVSFHGYDNAAGIRGKLEVCRGYKRPVLCTEWLHRPGGSTFAEILPLFMEAQVDAYHWGLVAGRTQTYMPWGSAPGTPEPAVWQHDVFRKDGTPFSADEHRHILELLGRSPAVSGREVVPTARGSAVAWRYTLEEPASDWMRPDFDDGAWAAGSAPFGRTEAPIARAPRTEWTGPRIWLRREFVWPTEGVRTPRLVTHYDEDPEIYINGVLAAKPEKWSDRYVEMDMTREAREALKPGTNTLAVLCRQTTGGQFIDVGIAGDPPEAAPAKGAWSPERAWQWFDAQPWPCGFNYVPANAISYTEMWMDYAFDEALIDRELALAQKTGFNVLRVVLPFVVWEKEPEAFKRRLDRFLGICERRGLRVMFALFDDCVFGPIKDPVFGPQPEVVAGWYANGWTPSPGHALVRDPATWPRLEKYVRDLVGSFGRDARVWVWDLYNEPGNSGIGDASVPLVERVFEWARSTAPSQPLTVGHWSGSARLNALIHEQSDITTFHNYSPPEQLARMIRDLQQHGRPLVCTEWLNRGQGSLVEGCLAVLRRGRVGAMHWGLVNGKTQTHLNWGHRPGQPDPPVWQHDLYRPDHTPYNATELAIFQRTIGAHD